MNTSSDGESDDDEIAEEEWASYDEWRALRDADNPHIPQQNQGTHIHQQIPAMSVQHNIPAIQTQHHIQEIPKPIPAIPKHIPAIQTQTLNSDLSDTSKTRLFVIGAILAAGGGLAALKQFNSKHRNNQTHYRSNSDPR